MNNLVFISDELNADILSLRFKRTTVAEKKLSNADKYVGIESALCGSELLRFVLFMVGECLYLGDNKDLQQLHNLGYPMHVTESQYFLFMEVT